jgi:chorismate mutase / prephenate dehydratase
VKDIRQLRSGIDEVDAKILKLLDERANLAGLIGDRKRQEVRVVYDPAREKRVVNRLTKLSPKNFPKSSISDVWREIIAACRSLERPLAIGFLGPEATFSHEAAIKRFGAANSFTQGTTIVEVLHMVERGVCDFAVVPIENSLQGVISTTLDYFIDSPLKICAEVYLNIAHHLLSREKTMDAVKVVYSHPQALFQCHNWLNQNMPGVERKEVESTAMAAEITMRTTGTAAVASRRAASFYRLNILSPRIEDNRNNTTRFIVVGHEELSEKSNSRTSILFSLKDEAGALFGALKPFSDNGVNLTKIESRPSKRGNWDYIFFADLDGHIKQPKIAKTINVVEKSCNFLKVLGSYPKASQSK